MFSFQRDIFAKIDKKKSLPIVKGCEKNYNIRGGRFTVGRLCSA